MKLKALGIIAVAGLAAFSLAACSAAPGGKASESKGTPIGDTFKLGYDLELSGAVAAYGNAGKKGADLAVDEINKAGGINDKQIKVVSKDNKSDNVEANTVASNLINNDKVNAIIGSMTSGAVKSMTPNVTKGAVPLVTPGGTDDTLTITNGKVNQYVFRSTFQDSYQGKVLANYTADKLNAKRVVLYYDNSSDYAKGIAKSFEKTYKGKIVDKVTFQSGDKDFQATLSKIKSEDFDAIVMPGYYSEAGLITKQARELGLQQPILGGDGFADPTFIALAGDAAATNVYYVSGYSGKTPANEVTKRLLLVIKQNIRLNRLCLMLCLMMLFTWSNKQQRIQKQNRLWMLKMGLLNLKDLKGRLEISQSIKTITLSKMRLLSNLKMVKKRQKRLLNLTNPTYMLGRCHKAI